MSNSRILLHPMITVPLMCQNYHLVHHVYPRVPFYRYAQCFDALRPEFEEDRVVYARRTTGDDCLTNLSGGFSSPAYFTRFFKNETGEQPARFRSTARASS